MKAGFLFSKIFFVYLQYYRVEVSINCHQGACLENWDREGLSLCGVKVSGYTMLPTSTHKYYAPKIHKNPTTLVVGGVRFVE